MRKLGTQFDDLAKEQAKPLNKQAREQSARLNKQ